MIYATNGARAFSNSAACFSGLIPAPPLVYIAGEEMTRYAGELYLQKWIRPFVDTSKWQFFDLSCRSRDDTKDQVLKDCIAAGKEIGAIYKEPTITPTEQQRHEMKLSKAWGSPNGAMRRGWNGITISRDTIHIDGMKLGFAKPVLFDRHAVGGEYGAGFAMVGKGRAETLFYPEGSSMSQLVDSRELPDNESALVVYHNPLDNVTQMAHHFFARCLEARVTPYVVTKKTVFKWQEGFWQRMKAVYDSDFKAKFTAAGVYTGELQHFLSDVATMQLIRWTSGGFGMCAHNYDGDVLTDELAQIHRSPGFLSSVLTGVREDGVHIREYEASHGTVTDMWMAHLRGEETSLNPLSMMEALIGAMIHSAKLAGDRDDLIQFSKRLQKAIHSQMVSGHGTRDLDKNGLTTEEFVDAVFRRLHDHRTEPLPSRLIEPTVEAQQTDYQLMRKLFNDLDTDGNGTIDFDEFSRGMKKLGVTPKKWVS
ncbi:MAG: isocitrate/isopropylmalate family dehydrogenase [archaeon]|nr:isocitrate/isopropylmalate family dehydrogenase [archaeon]